MSSKISQFVKLSLCDIFYQRSGADKVESRNDDDEGWLEVHLENVPALLWWNDRFFSIFYTFFIFHLELIQMFSVDKRGQFHKTFFPKLDQEW